MALRDQPYLPLYVQDFMTDEKLAECSPAATGVYIRIMCLMHKSEEYGKIALNSRDASLFSGSPVDMFAAKLVRHLPYTEMEIKSALRELIEEKVLYIDGTYLCQKRMIHDAEISEKRASAGRKGSDVTNVRFAAAKSSAKSSAKEETESQEPSEPKEVKPKKKKYADTVKMTEEEYSKLVAEYGEDGAQGMVTILDNYKAASGHTYKSDYRAILNWVVERYKKDHANGYQYNQRSDERNQRKQEFAEHIYNKLGDKE